MGLTIAFSRIAAQIAAATLGFLLQSWFLAIGLGLAYFLLGLFYSEWHFRKSAAVFLERTGINMMSHPHKSSHAKMALPARIRDFSIGTASCTLLFAAGYSARFAVTAI